VIWGLKIFILLLSFKSEATLYQPLPIGQQIKDADAIIVGHFLKRKIIKLENGAIVTQMFFKMNQEYGIQSDFFGMEEIIVHYPGGTFGETNGVSQGFPDFIPGENVVLMIKNGHDRFWGMNLGIGAFKIINYGKYKIMVNSIYPDDPIIGQLKFDEFEKSVKLIRGSGLKMVHSLIQLEELSEKKSDRLPASESEVEGRSIASNHQKAENVFDSGISHSWLLITLSLMGGIFSYLKRKSS
jgi:hypothetical protein